MLVFSLRKWTLEMKIRKVACRFNDLLPVRLKHKKKGERKKWKVRKVTVLINSWTWSARSCRKVQCGCRIARIADNFASRNFLTCAFQSTAQYILLDTYLPGLLYILLWSQIKMVRLNPASTSREHISHYLYYSQPAATDTPDRFLSRL